MSKNIFIQVDTDSIIAAAMLGATIDCALASQHCLIFDQGSMAMGKPVKTFTLGVEIDDEISFTILPLKLFTHHKIYFTSFTVTSTSDIIAVNYKTGPEGQITFTIGIEAGSDPYNGTNPDILFSLGAIIEYLDFENNFQSIEINIDPVLRAKQK